jgi:hypothetical protein
MRIDTLVFGCLATVAMACTEERSPGNSRTGSPTISVAFETTLQESDSLILSSPGFLAVSPSGFVISDATFQRVLNVSRTGTIENTFGRQGRGPGEFVGLGYLFFLDDTTLAVVDHTLAAITRVSWPEGKYMGHRPFAGESLYGAVREGSTIWLALLGPRSGVPRRAIAKWSLPNDSIDFIQIAPPEYSVHPTSPLLVFATVRLDVTGDTITSIFGARNTVELFDTTGTDLGKWELPVALRRGVPQDTKDLFTNPGTEGMQSITYEGIQKAFSSPRAVKRLSNGMTAIILADQSANGPVITAQHWALLISRDFTRACVDGEVPISEDARPAMAFHGDTLFVIDQVLQDEKVTARLRGYLISDKGCSWQPMTVPETGPQSVSSN